MASNNTRERLVETAIDLIWRSSYGAVSVDDICKAADVRKGSFYHYFPSKIDLAIAAMEATFEKHRPAFDGLFSPTKSPIQRFKEYIQFCYDSQKEIQETHNMVCGCPMISLASEMAPQDQSIHDATDRIIALKMKYFKTALSDLIEEGFLPKDTDIETKANNLHSYVLGQFVLARIQNSLKPLEPSVLADGFFGVIGLKVDAFESV